MDTYNRLHAVRSNSLHPTHTTSDHAPRFSFWLIAFWMACGSLTVGLLQLLVR